jgi:hypothetical protein
MTFQQHMRTRAQRDMPGEIIHPKTETVSPCTMLHSTQRRAHFKKQCGVGNYTLKNRLCLRPRSIYLACLKHRSGDARLVDVVLSNTAIKTLLGQDRAC